MTSPVSSSPLSRRVRTLVPLHQGLGFGAEAIRARALEVARSAQARHDARRRDVERTPLGAPLEASPRSESLRGAAVAEASAAPTGGEIRAGVDTAGAESALQSLQTLSLRREKADTHGDVVSTRSSSLGASHGMSLPTGPGKTLAPRLGRGRVLAAWGLDLVVAGCVWVLGAVASFSLAPSSFGQFLSQAVIQGVSRGADFFGYTMVASSVPWMTFLVLAFGMALVGLFVCQLLSVSFFRSTLGRFVVGVELSKAHQGVLSRVGLALSETLTFGGVFALPFVLITPKRVPLFLWIKLESGD